MIIALKWITCQNMCPTIKFLEDNIVENVVDIDRTFIFR